MRLAKKTSNEIILIESKLLFSHSTCHVKIIELPSQSLKTHVLLYISKIYYILTEQNKFYRFHIIKSNFLLFSSKNKIKLHIYLSFKTSDFFAHVYNCQNVQKPKKTGRYFSLDFCVDLKNTLWL